MRSCSLVTLKMWDGTAALRFPLLLVLALLVLEARAQQTFVELDLNAADWEISNQNGSVSVSSVQLPVMALQALYEAGKLSDGDPIYRYGHMHLGVLYIPTLVCLLRQFYGKTYDCSR